MDCCKPSKEKTSENTELNFSCPKCNNEGKIIDLITLKSLLTPKALTRIEPKSNYRMCINRNCEVVYFNEREETYLTDDLKVPVYQKSEAGNCPVCYCFGWTREEVKKVAQNNKGEDIIKTITKYIKEGKCGCNVNNPQGSCCLSNVKETLEFYELK